MKTMRKLLFADIITAVLFVAGAFLSLFFFIDFVQQLQAVSRGGYTVAQAALFCVLSLPGHFYELAPIAVLIGSIYALSRMAQSSEFTILRTGGLGPGRALWLLLQLGLGFSLMTFIVGDYIAPWSETRSAEVEAIYKNPKWSHTGAWLKDRAVTSDGERNYTIQIGATSASGELQRVTWLAFDDRGRLLERLQAKTVQVDEYGLWRMADVTRSTWPVINSTQGQPAIHREQLDRWEWSSNLPMRVVSAAVLPLSSMSTLELARYINHLSDNEQAAQQYQIQFWKRALYPLACLVMLGLALPFAYLHARAGGISLKVFGGIMLGISFVLLNNVAGHLGMLRNWTPWLVAATPSLLYLLMSMAAFGWLVRYR